MARRTSVEREALAAPRSGEPECATIERLQDELRELREGWALPVRPTKIPQSPMFDAPSRDRSIVAQGRP